LSETPYFLYVENLIYSAPTSAGKTLVSELIMLKNLIEEPTRKALIVMPYVSLVTEKEDKLRMLLRPLGLKLQSIHSHKRKCVKH
jgi:DNA polymerase theta